MLHDRVGLVNFGRAALEHLIPKAGVKFPNEMIKLLRGGVN